MEVINQPDSPADLPPDKASLREGGSHIRRIKLVECRHSYRTTLTEFLWFMSLTPVEYRKCVPQYANSIPLFS
jgi:hypothetical protein